MSPPEPPSDAAHTAPLAACSPQAPTCCGALRLLCGASTSAAAMSHQEAPPAPAPKHGESGAGAKDATGATSAEPLDPKARDALRSAFYEGATKSNINDVYALGSTIGAFFCCDMLRRVLAYERAVRNWRLCCGAAGHASSVARRRGGEGAVPVDRAYCRNRGASAGAMQIQVADVVCRPRLLCRRRSRLRLRCGLVLRALRQKRT